MNKIILNAQALDGYLTEADKKNILSMEELYRKAVASFEILSASDSIKVRSEEEKKLTIWYNEMGALMQEICSKEPSINVYSFVTPPENHGEASRLIAKLRNVKTGRQEFIYYIQRAYELLFNLTFCSPGGRPGNTPEKNYLVIKTPVTVPTQNYAVHKIPNVDTRIQNTVMCVMLRGSLLPSMIMSKEIQEYSSSAYLTPFALFRIKRDDTRSEKDMNYILDLDRSYFVPEDIDGKDLVFADPMNATGGSMVTIINFLKDQGIKPKSVYCLNAISAFKGALRIARAVENVSINTLWLDPVLNEKAYIMPGLGDAGDRINGTDVEESPRDILQLLTDYGSNVTGLYRSQLRIIEKTVLSLNRESWHAKHKASHP